MIDSIEFAYAFGGPLGDGLFKHLPEDFVVTEVLGWSPEGVGEHIYLDITKRGENTGWVAKAIAEYANVKENDVGYCGLKDRNAITRQWFSVYCPKGHDRHWFDLPQVTGLDLKVHDVSAGQRKLRRGQHQNNEFDILIRNVSAVDKALLNKRLSLIAEQGVPNYFGEQRFGRQRGNLRAAQQWSEQQVGKPKRNKSFVLSAARSLLFNLVLSRRVISNCWSTPVRGDVCSQDRPTAPLWGRGRTPVEHDALALESAALDGWQAWCHSLEHSGLNQERRDCVLNPQGFNWQITTQGCQLKFALPTGSYATSLLREIFHLVSISELQT